MSVNVIIGFYVSSDASIMKLPITDQSRNIGEIGIVILDCCLNICKKANFENTYDTCIIIALNLK